MHARPKAGVYFSRPQIIHLKNDWGGQCHLEANVFFSLGGRVFFLGEANVGEVNEIINFEGSHFVNCSCNGIRWPKEPVGKVVLTGDPKSRFKKKFG